MNYQPPPRCDQAFAAAFAPDVPAADDPPKPIPPAVDVFVWLVVEPVTVPVTPKPDPAAAPDRPLAEPLSVAEKIPIPATPAEVEPPDVELLLELVPVANAEMEATDSSNAARSLFMIISDTGVN